MNQSNFTRIRKEDKHTEAFAHFELEMEGREYGPDETLGAWLFFESGWNAYRDSQPPDSELAKSLAQDKDAPYG